jgi:hypothetical protein
MNTELHKKNFKQKEVQPGTLDKGQLPDCTLVYYIEKTARGGEGLYL